MLLIMSTFTINMSKEIPKRYGYYVRLIQLQSNVVICVLNKYELFRSLILEIIGVDC